MRGYRIRLIDAGNRNWETTMEEFDSDLPEAIKKLVAGIGSGLESIRLPAIIIIDSESAPMPEWSLQ